MATIDDLVKRLNTPYKNDTTSNNYKLLTIPAVQKDEIKVVGDDVGEALNVEQATGISLDRLGVLIVCTRTTGESDTNYRNRIKDWMHSLIGGGTTEQLEHTIRMAIPGITDDDFEVIDGYGTSTHGDPNHYAHIKVRIDIGFDWAINNLWEMLDKARAACITIDELGPLVAETLTWSETVSIGWGSIVQENLVWSEVVEKEIDKPIGESLTWSEPRAGSMCHYCDITKVDSLNYLCS